MDEQEAPRSRVVSTAGRLFLARGYVDTTIGAIAREAGVALRTIYSGFGSKVGVLAAVQDRAVAGDDEPVPLAERPWVRALPTLRPREALHSVVDHLAAATERVAPIHEVIAAAASDTGVRDLLDVLHARRAGTALAVATQVVGAPRDDGERAQQLADGLYALLGVETYLLLVTRRGWSRDRWAAWAEERLLPDLV